uniref:Uncharacterized protein n=1 Tax=Chromera velia CCMP2878 TaxID=1169474 RepID=A0A0K6S5X8_9ALVE|eukprot:Cvel_15166.t1-p1 / transcript=Cvel_15166.t1 / gene=Cvel_15166 / organism=Chromera_velia_CCMP2878 / gene_product=hypothetical protein / transcript_product=hypothetical protein / location=Cvel_scaffold1108:17771-21328(-) / protein_length=353 / sequence_SO=supercontig / SO=protein_coding / is_pseudo=false
MSQSANSPQTPPLVEEHSQSSDRGLAEKKNELYVVFGHACLTAETLSGLLKERDSFGLAWLCVWLYGRKKAHGKVGIHLPRFLDLSGKFNISVKKMFFFLDCLQESAVEEVKFGSMWVRGGLLPLLVGFLERLKAARMGRKRTPELKSFIFEGNPFGPSFGLDDFQILTKAIRDGMVCSLRKLDLENVRLEKEVLKMFCEAIKETGLPQIETLNLSNNRLGMEGFDVLCSDVLCVASVPRLRELLLRDCLLGGSDVALPASVLGRGDLPNLESLDLQGNGIAGGSGLGDLGEVLRVECVPRLKNLNVMMRERGGWDPQAVSDFLAALRSDECPALEHLHLRMHTGNDEVVALW